MDQRMSFWYWLYDMSKCRRSKFWSVFIYIHISCLWAAKALASLCIYTCSFLDNAIRTKLVFGPYFVMQYLVSFLVVHSSRRGRESLLRPCVIWLLVLCVSSSHGAMGWSAVCDCCMSSSYLLTFWPLGSLSDEQVLDMIMLWFDLRYL